MVDSLSKGAISALFLFIAGLALWPPGNVYWDHVTEIVGNSVTLAMVIAIALGVGAVFVWGTSIDVPLVAVGGGLAYVGWMLVIEATMTPDSPVHFVWYGVLLASFIGGAILQRRFTSHSPLRRPSINDR